MFKISMQFQLTNPSQIKTFLKFQKLVKFILNSIHVLNIWAAKKHSGDRDGKMKITYSLSVKTDFSY